MVQEQQHEELNRISERIIACVYRVSNTLGAGFLEKVYENALAIELRKNGHKVEQQHLIKVLYNGELVGDFAADLLVDERVTHRVENGTSFRRRTLRAMYKIISRRQGISSAY